MIKFEETFEREQLLKRKYTYKVMKKLFMSFSHEFGTSLNCILGLSQTALYDRDVSLKILTNYFDPMLKSARIMHSIVQDMRDYNSIMGSTFQLTITSFRLSELIKETVELFQKQIEGKGVDLLVELQEDLVDMIINQDKERIQQVLVNFLSNASKFTFKGHIKMQVNSFFFQQVKILKFVVEDTGIGMSEDDKKRLENLLNMNFEEEKVSKNTAGYGLGLYISNFLAQQLGKLKRNQGGGV